MEGKPFLLDHCLLDVLKCLCWAFPQKWRSGKPSERTENGVVHLHPPGTFSVSETLGATDSLVWARQRQRWKPARRWRRSAYIVVAHGTKKPRVAASTRFFSAGVSEHRNTRGGTTLSLCFGALSLEVAWCVSMLQTCKKGQNGGFWKSTLSWCLRRRRRDGWKPSRAGMGIEGLVRHNASAPSHWPAHKTNAKYTVLGLFKIC